MNQLLALSAALAALAPAPATAAAVGTAPHLAARAAHQQHQQQIEARASTSCPAGYYYHSNDAGCYPCGANALTCKSTTIALTCRKGYTVQGGLCKLPAAAVKKTTTTTKKKVTTTTVKKTSSTKAAAAAAATTAKAAAAATVTRTVTLPASTITFIDSLATTCPTVPTTSSTDDGDDDSDDGSCDDPVILTAYVTMTTASLVTSTSTRTVTLTSTTTATSTTVSTTTLTTGAAAATSTARTGQIVYAGCFAGATLSTYQLDQEMVKSPTPFTASTAVGQCLYQLAAMTAKYGKKYTHCQIQGNIAFLYAMDQTSYSILPGKAADSNCDTVCSVDKTVTAVYGTEYCGSNSGAYNSMYTLPVLAS